MQYRSALAGILISLATATIAPAATIYSPNPGYNRDVVPPEGAINAGIFNRIDTRKQWFFSPRIMGDFAVTISAMSFRYDSIVTDMSRKGGVITVDDRFDVRLAQLATPPTTTFDNNIPDAVRVLGGAQDIPFRIGGGEGETKAFGVTLNFTTPFVYRPGNGWLVVDLFLPAQDNLTTFDFVIDNPDTFRLFSLTSVTTGEIQPRAPVVRFDVENYSALPGGGGSGGGAGGAAVPEPATWLMLVTGFGALGATVRRRRALAATV